LRPPKSPGTWAAEIFGTASTAKHEAIKTQVVEHAIDYRNQDFKAEIRRLTNGEGVDVILDPIRPSSFRKALLSSLLRTPTSTMPWWNAGRLLNQGRGVFGLNLLSCGAGKAAWIGLLNRYSVIWRTNGSSLWSHGPLLSNRRRGTPVPSRPLQYRQSGPHTGLVGEAGRAAAEPLTSFRTRPRLRAFAAFSSLIHGFVSKNGRPVPKEVRFRGRRCR
jgi:hypothetical protein